MSRFAQYQQQLAAIPVMPPPQRRGLFGGLRNFAQQAQQPGGFVDRLQMFGASMQDIGQLDGVNRAGRLSESRREAQEAAAQREAMAALRAQVGPGASPQAVRQAFMSASLNGVDVGDASRLYEQMNPAPQRFNTTEGVVEIGPDGQGRLVYTAPDDPYENYGAIPTGMVRNEDGSLEWADGYVDSQLDLGRGRRRTIIENPTPSRARAGGGGRGGARPAASGARAPTIINPQTVRWD
jgi:hypothetical protein